MRREACPSHCRRRPAWPMVRPCGPPRAPVAQLDRALPSEGRGHRFESCRVRHSFSLSRRDARRCACVRSRIVGRAGGRQIDTRGANPPSAPTRETPILLTQGRLGTGERMSRSAYRGIRQRPARDRGAQSETACESRNQGGGRGERVTRRALPLKQLPATGEPDGLMPPCRGRRKRPTDSQLQVCPRCKV